MKLRSSAIVLFLLSAPIAAAATLAGAPPATPTPPPSAAGAAAARAVPASPSTLESLRRQFSDLSRWLSTRGVGPDERREIEAFRARAAGFDQAEGDNPAVRAMLTQAAIWLGDVDAVDASFAKLLALRPGDDAVLATWARFWMGRNRFERVLEIVEANLVDPARSPQSVALAAEALIAMHRFADATAALDGIPADAVTDPNAAAELARLRSAVEQTAAAWVTEEALRAAEATADDLPRVELVIERPGAESAEGTTTIVLELFENSAPNTVANFIDLVGKEFYDGTAFHRVLPAFMAQGGDPNSRPGATGPVGQGGPGYRIAGEATLEQARKHFAGSLGMAHNGDPDNAGSGFYMCFVPAPHLDGIHTVFGRVLEGQDALLEVQQNDVLKSARVLRKRDHEYVPVTLPPLPPPAPAPSGLPPGFSLPPGFEGSVRQVPPPTR